MAFEDQRRVYDALYVEAVTIINEIKVYIVRTVVIKRRALKQLFICNISISTNSEVQMTVILGRNHIRGQILDDTHRWNDCLYGSARTEIP